jgi:non-ribosomal peptide synthetase component F
MSDLADLMSDLPLEQQAIWAKCVHPTGTFVEFTQAEVEQSLPDRFEQQVAQYPDRIAVKTAHGALTYHELNQAANRVARAILARAGTGQEPVGLLFENGAQAISAIFGVLKAGKFYVPLDPSFPHGRLAAILEDAETQLLVTNSQNYGVASALTRGRLQLLNVDTTDAGVSDANLGLSVSPEDFACICYTSGSTGQPKGVVQNHRCLLHVTMIHTNSVRVTPDDRLTLLHSWSVLSCAAHLFGSLLNGAARFPFDPRLGGGEQLARWLRQEQITMYHSVPIPTATLLFNVRVATRYAAPVYPIPSLYTAGKQTRERPCHAKRPTPALARAARACHAPRRTCRQAQRWLSPPVASSRGVAGAAPSHEPLADGRTALHLGCAQAAAGRGAAPSPSCRRRCPSRARGGPGKRCGSCPYR